MPQLNDLSTRLNDEITQDAMRDLFIAQRLPFDHLIFTGSTSTGREVMKTAAENLTPVTLELGGKSPAIVCADSSLEKVARSIAFGKFLNVRTDLHCA